jgi:hypothetical protein
METKPTRTRRKRVSSDLRNVPLAALSFAGVSKKTWYSNTKRSAMEIIELCAPDLSDDEVEVLIYLAHNTDATLLSIVKYFELSRDQPVLMETLRSLSIWGTPAYKQWRRSTAAIRSAATRARNRLKMKTEDSMDAGMCWAVACNGGCFLMVGGFSCNAAVWWRGKRVCGRGKPSAATDRSGGRRRNRSSCSSGRRRRGRGTSTQH